MKAIISILLILNSLFSLCQWGLFLGHDLGFSKVTYHTKKPIGSIDENHKIHRFKLFGEFQFKNNIVISTNTGLDWQLINHSYTSEGHFSGLPSRQTRDIKGFIKSYRLGISLGYYFPINENNKLGVNLGYDQYFVTKFNIKQSNYIREVFDENNDIQIFTKEFKPLINPEAIGYKNKVIRENRHIILSLRYQYEFNKFNISPSFSFFPFNNVLWRNPAVIPKFQNVFLFGVNFGYTLPQKSKNNEK